MKHLVWVGALFMLFSCHNNKSDDVAVSLNFSDVFVVFIIAGQSEIDNNTLVEFYSIDATPLDNAGRGYLLTDEGTLRVRDLQIQYQNKILIIDNNVVNTNERGVVITKDSVIYTGNLYWLYEGGLRKFF